MPGKVINTAAVAEAGYVLVRSVTKVDKALLAGVGLSLLAPAPLVWIILIKTILRDQGIGFASAPVQCQCGSRLCTLPWLRWRWSSVCLATKTSWYCWPWQCRKSAENTC